MNKIIKSKSLPIAFMYLASLSAILIYSLRFSWVFINTTVKMNGFAMGVLCAASLSAFILGILAYIRVNDFALYKNKAYSVVSGITCVLTIILTIAGIVYFVISASSESLTVSLLYMKEALGKTIFLILVPTLVIFMPKSNNQIAKIISALSFSLVFIVAFASLFPVGSYKITNHPAVIDNGSEYSVVFATNKNGTGYVEYSFDGKDYKIFDENGGRLNSDSKIHSIPVPYEHLKNNSYSVGSVRVVEDYSYGSRLGKEVKSEKYNFNVNESKNQTYLVVSDWHTELDKAYSAISHVDDYEGVILLGDASPGVDFEDEVVRNIVEFAGEVSKGTMPILYTRGNHETRGAYAGKILDSLGLHEFYYKAEMGDIDFIILDSGEDKDDSHPEYGGLDNYNNYRIENLNWLKTLDKDSNKVIVLSHSWTMNDVEREISDLCWAEIDRLGARLMISGHTHNCRFIGENSDHEKEIFTKYSHITGYMDGGNTNEDFIASKMTITDENIKLEAFNMSGEKVFDESLKW